ncbi:unnamed protein product [Fusarium graminearum]|nr:unnamed protein product [Fusarium graminearum]
MMGHSWPLHLGHGRPDTTFLFFLQTHPQQPTL